MSIKKRLGDTGSYIVSSIEVKKSYVNVNFYSGEKIKLDYSSYVNGIRLYTDKEISESEFRTLEKESSSFNSYSYLIKLVSGSKMYSKKEIINKLMKVKGLSYEDGEKLISKAYKEGLINDDLYISTYVNDASLKGYSKDYVIDFLTSNKYKEERFLPIVEKTDFSSSIKEVVENEMKKMKGRNLPSIEDNLRAKLSKLGYSSYESSSLIKNFLKENPSYLESADKKKEESLRSDMERIYSSLSNCSDDKEEIKRKTISRLLSRKYEFNDIIDMWKELIG